MVFEGVWNMWPFRGYFNTRPTRRTKQSCRCPSNPKGQTEPLIQFLGPWESNMITLQSILIWEKPGKSIVAIVAANVIYWYLASSEVRFFFGVSALGLAAFLHHQWVYSIWPEISVPKPQADQEEWTPVHPSVLSAPEVSRYLENTWQYIQEQQIRLAQLRRKQPGWFCAGMVTTLSLLWLLGHFVSGVILLYSLLMGVMCGPAFLIHFVPKSTFKQIEKFISSLFRKKSGSSESPENDLAEFLPEETSLEVQTALGIPLTSHEQADELGEIRRDSKGRQRGRSGRGRRGRGRINVSSEVGSSFTSGLSESDFPTLEESLDYVEESDLALPEIVPEEVIDKRISTEEGMNFVPTHFGDSSDDDDDFAIGLSFRRISTTPTTTTTPSDFHAQLPETSPVVFPPPSAATVVMNQLVGSIAAENTAATILSSIGQHLVSVIAGTVPQVEEEEEEEEEETTTTTTKRMTNSGSSFEEEFELISDDDLQ